MLLADSQPVAGLSPSWKKNSRSLGFVNQKDLVTATDMIEENMERGERQFAAETLPRGPARVESPGWGKGLETHWKCICNLVDFTKVFSHL